jgi:hypothetical protein
LTVLSRSSSASIFPASVKVLHVDYTSIESLTAALKGQDAVISAVGNEGLPGQSVLVDASIAAGVKRFLPSEFGLDTGNSKAAALPVFGYKVATRKHIEEKVAAGAGITYTYVINGPFLDWGLERQMLLNWDGEGTRIYDGGNQLISTTTLHSVGLAVVGVLDHYDETKNKSVFVQDIQISQNRLLELAKKIQPNKNWEPTEVSLAEIE